MKMSIEDYLSCSFKITFCIDENTMKTVVFEPEWEDDWLTINHGDHCYDLNLWLDDDDSVKFGVYRLKQDPDHSTDGMWVMDSKVVCSNECPNAVIQIVTC